MISIFRFDIFKNFLLRLATYTVPFSKVRKEIRKRIIRFVNVSNDVLIDEKDLTIVMQGPIVPVTKKCLKSIRKYLPNSKIILSTWEGGGAIDLEYDEIIYNKDPGISGYRNTLSRIEDNTNRQIVSSLNGLKQVKTKYAMKLRTDFCFVGKGFLRYFKKYNQYFEKDKYKIFKDRVLLSFYPGSTYTINDFTFLGNTDDLIKIFDIPLISEADSYYMCNNEPIDYRSFLKHGSSLRYFPEYYLGVNLYKNIEPNIMDIFPEYTSPVSKKGYEDYEKFLINNFVWVGYYDNAGILPKKACLKNAFLKTNYYTHRDFLMRYNNYLNSAKSVLSI